METRHIVTNPNHIREAIHSNVKLAIASKFPIESNKFKAVVSNLEFKTVEMPHAKQKDVLMAKGNASDALYGDIDIIDKGTNSTVASIKKHRIVNVPYYTNRYTMMVDGNEYAIVNQMRTKPGVYTRKRGNDEIESSFNLSKGANFKLIMDPATGIFKISIMNATIHAYALLKILGAASTDIVKAIGTELFKKNSDISETQIDRARNTLYDKLIKSGLGASASKAERDSKIREYFSGTEIDPETTKLTLGSAYSSVSARTLLDAMERTLKVYDNSEDIDERDNIEFQKVYSVEDIVREVIEKNNDAVLKIKTKLNAFKPSGNQADDTATLKAIISPVYFSKPIRNFITTSSISRMPSQINPMEIMDTAAIITRLGEGAISSEDAVPDETRQVNYSYMGVIDPIATPESSKVGIDNRVTIEALKGADNEFYKKVVNIKTGKTEVVKAILLYDKYVGFPDAGHDEGKKAAVVPAVFKAKMVNVPRTMLDYQFANGNSMLTHSTASIPFVNAIQGNRAIMGDKHVQQALPVLDADKRLVATMNTYTSMEHGGAQVKEPSVKTIGRMMLPTAPISGEVSHIDDAFITIKSGSTEVKVDYAKNMPLATKTLLDNTLKVKVGDKVNKGDTLAESNFTKDGELAMGKNLRVAYMPYYGMNHEDGVVISEAAAHKMTSVHADKVTMNLTNLTVLDKNKYLKYFPTTFTKEQLSRLDNLGVAKEGTILKSGDPIIIALEDDSNSRKNLVLGMLHRSFITPFRDISEVYDMPYDAEVITVQKTNSLVNVLLKIHKPIQVGDKIAGSYGNKGVVTTIIPTDKMPHDNEGRPMEVLLTPVGVVGRINPAQILETALGKVAEKTGKRYEIENFAINDYTQFVKNEMDKHGVPDKETLIDPITGRELHGVFAGIQHMHKLFKTTDTNYAARSTDGPHDTDDSPTGSGDSGPKALGGMEINMLLAHNARNLLKESTMLRGAKNADYWRSFQNGMTPNFPVEKKTFTRFSGILRQAGIKLDKQGSNIVLGPLTDKDVLEQSHGEITDAKMLSAKTLAPEEHGLFDEVKTGGLGGTKWTHIKLHEPVVNPVFEDAAKSLLGMSTSDFMGHLEEHGAVNIKDKLNSIDVKKEIEAVLNSINSGSLKNEHLDKASKRLKYLRALDKQGMKAGDAYVLTVLPVTPPMFRPITISKTGDTMGNDANNLYKDIILHNNSIGDIKKAGMDFAVQENRVPFYNSVKELTGMLSPTSPHLKNRGVKGALEFIAGDAPKHGFFQRKVIYGKMNLSGRATIVPDKDLDLDEIGLPDKMAWEMYKPFIIRDLVQRGYSALAAREEVTNHSETAKTLLLEQMENRPVLFNRAPTLHRHNIVALKPTLRDSKNLHINSIIEKGLNADYDGDACTVHTPITDEAVKEAWGLLPSKQVFTDKKKNDVIQMPSNEPVVGLFRATQNVGTAPTKSTNVRKYKTAGEAWKDYYAGKLKMTDFVEIG